MSDKPSEHGKTRPRERGMRSCDMCPKSMRAKMREEGYFGRYRAPAPPAAPAT